MNDEHFSFGVRLASGVDVFTQYYIRRPMVFIVGASAPLIGEPRLASMKAPPNQQKERSGLASILDWSSRKSTS